MVDTVKENKEQKKKDDADVKIAELTESLQRLQAEFENYKKYVEKEKVEFTRYAKADMLQKLLPLLVSFELSLQHRGNKEEFIEGMEIVYSQFHTLLEKEGLKPIKAEGKLNPHLHEVLLMEPSAKEEDTILAELQKGYMLYDKVLRYSKVKVSKKDDKPQ